MATKPEKVSVIGAGLMGAEIALVYAMAGHPVMLTDTSDEALGKAKTRLADILSKGVTRGHFQEADTAGTLNRIRPTTKMPDLADSDLVVEAVFEDEKVKAEIWGKLDKIVKKGAVFASNTSTIPISTLASYVSPERRPNFLGTHYFSPVSRMKLVEVIPAFDTSEAAIATAFRLAEGAGKVAIRVKDVAGFAVNRVLHAFLIEAVRLVEEEVVTAAELDTACRLGLGHPMGPFELMDAVTNSLTLQAQQIMQDSYGERFRPRPLLKQMVQSGRTGRKANAGWRVGPGTK